MLVVFSPIFVADTKMIGSYNFVDWSEELFVIKKVKNTVPSTSVIETCNREEVLGTFYEKELSKSNEAEFRIKKVIKKQGDRLYFKWKDYDNSFNSWIDKKYVVT